MIYEKRAALAQDRDTVLEDHSSDDGHIRETELIRLDGALKELCPHDSINWNSRSADDGRIITTCERCGVSWFEHVR